MASLFNALPALQDFFPPTPQAFKTVGWMFFPGFSVMSLLSWTPLRHYQAMGKTSRESRLNLPGRYAWAAAEVVAPINILFIMYTLPSRLRGLPASTGIFGTGLPIQNEVMGMLYVVHYMNRALISPLILAPSMSPIHPFVSIAMATHQFLCSACLGCWVSYAAVNQGNKTPVLSPLSMLGISVFTLGLAGNIIAENTLFDLRIGAARRKAKSEGRATVTYDKVYVIPPVQGLFRYVLNPHYALEWLEWTGYYILGGAWGLGWSFQNSAALWFLINEFIAMTPRAITSVEWYESKFGKRAVAGRKAVLPGLL